MRRRSNGPLKAIRSTGESMEDVAELPKMTLAEGKHRLMDDIRLLSSVTIHFSRNRLCENGIAQPGQ